MKRSQFTEEQIVFAFKQSETGIRFLRYAEKWVYLKQLFIIEKKKFRGLGPSELRRRRQLEEENRQLKKLIADLSLDKQTLQDY